MKRNLKCRREGAKAFEDNKSLTRDNPYEQGTLEWQAWVNGFCDAGDDLFVKLYDELSNKPIEEIL
jgi:hypothetical protein